MQYVILTRGLQTAEPFIGSLPPTKDRELKWWGQKIFRNTNEVLPGRFISMPPAEVDYAQWQVSETLKEDVAQVSRVFYGNEAATWELEKHRICWYVPRHILFCVSRESHQNECVYYSMCRGIC